VITRYESSPASRPWQPDRNLIKDPRRASVVAIRVVP